MAAEYCAGLGHCEAQDSSRSAGLQECAHAVRSEVRLQTRGKQHLMLRVTLRQFGMHLSKLVSGCDEGVHRVCCICPGLLLEHRLAPSCASLRLLAGEHLCMQRTGLPTDLLASFPCRAHVHLGLLWTACTMPAVIESVPVLL